MNYEQLMIIQQCILTGLDDMDDGGNRHVEGDREPEERGVARSHVADHARCCHPTAESALV